MKRVAVEGVLGLVSAALGVLTLLTRDWIEVVFRVDPDKSSGLLEWVVVVSLATLSLFWSTRAVRAWRTARTATE